MQIDDYRSKFNVVTEIQKYTKDRHCFGIESKKKKKKNTGNMKIIKIFLNNY